EEAQRPGSDGISAHRKLGVLVNQAEIGLDTAELAAGIDETLEPGFFDDSVLDRKHDPAPLIVLVDREKRGVAGQFVVRAFSAEFDVPALPIGLRPAKAHDTLFPAVVQQMCRSAEQSFAAGLDGEVIVLAVAPVGETIDLERPTGKRMSDVAADIIGFPDVPLAKNVLPDGAAAKHNCARLVDWPGVDRDRCVDMCGAAFTGFVSPAERSGLVGLAAIPEDVTGLADCPRGQIHEQVETVLAMGGAL